MTDTNRLTSRQITTIANAVDVSIPTDPLPEVFQRAIAHFNARRKPDTPAAHWDSNTDFLARITVNYLRHVCSNYDSYRNQLRRLHPHDRNAVGSIVKARVLATIARTYPTLREACRQAAEWDDQQRTLSVSGHRH